MGTGCESVFFKEEARNRPFRTFVNILRITLSLYATFKQVIIFKFPCKMYNKKGYPHIYIHY